MPAYSHFMIFGDLLDIFNNFNSTLVTAVENKWLTIVFIIQTDIELIDITKYWVFSKKCQFWISAAILEFSIILVIA